MIFVCCSIRKKKDMECVICATRKKKKMGVLMITCDKCGYSSCLTHRFHECMASKDKQILSENNPKIAPSKLDKI